MKIAAYNSGELTITLVDTDTDETVDEIDRMTDFTRGDMEPREAAEDWCAAYGHTLVEWEGGAGMNQTEAWEAVYGAAFAALSLGIRSGMMEADEQRRLAAACKKVKPRVERMRSRLDFARARKAGKLNRPSWATP